MSNASMPSLSHNEPAKSPSITELFNIIHPIFQAPMAGGITTPELVASVTNSGGMGSIAGGYLTVDALRDQIEAVQNLTEGTFAVNLFAHTTEGNFDDEIISASDHLASVCETLNIPSIGREYLNDLPQTLPDLNEKIKCVIEMQVKVVSFTFGIPDQSILDDIKSAGIQIIGVATHLLEVVLWENKGAKAVVLQGLEAGGHRATFIGDPLKVMQPVAALISQMKQELPTLPIIAAGGIMDARSIASAYILGADGVMLGTAFLCAHEAGTSEAYRTRLLSCNELDLTLTNAWSGKWARGLKNAALNELEKASSEAIASFPIQHYLTVPIRQYGQNNEDANYMALWAGTGFMRCQSESVSSLMNEWLYDLLKLNLS